MNGSRTAVSAGVLRATQPQDAVWYPVTCTQSPPPPRTVPGLELSPASATDFALPPCLSHPHPLPVFPRPSHPSWRGPCSSQESSQPRFHQDTALGKDPAGSPNYFISAGTASPSERVSSRRPHAAETQGAQRPLWLLPLAENLHPKGVHGP